MSTQRPSWTIINHDALLALSAKESRHRLLLLLMLPPPPPLPTSFQASQIIMSMAGVGQTRPGQASPAKSACLPTGCSLSSTIFLSLSLSVLSSHLYSFVAFSFGHLLQLLRRALRCRPRSVLGIATRRAANSTQIANDQNKIWQQRSHNNNNNNKACRHTMYAINSAEDRPDWRSLCHVVYRWFSPSLLFSTCFPSFFAFALRVHN